MAVDMGVAIQVPARREKKITRQEVAKAIKDSCGLVLKKKGRK